MTKHVEIWTLSKESRLVPYMTSSVEFYEYSHPTLSSPEMYVMGGKFTDRVERRHMDIIQVTECSAIYDRMKIDSKIERSDKYIAIHPDVEEAISVKWKEKVSKVEADNLSLLKRYYTLLDSVDDFKKLPWYKRVWRAICNGI